MSLQYRGFDLDGIAICIVVEPWPPIRTAINIPTTTTHLPPSLERKQTAPPDRGTPLFLPDFDHTTITPAHAMKNRDPKSSRIPDANDTHSQSSLLRLSQAVNRQWYPPGEDEGDVDEQLLYGDADEARITLDT